MRAAVLALLVLSSAVAARDVPPLTGRVVDTADLLSPAAEAALTARLAAFEDSTSAQIVVLTIASLDGEVLEEYATRVFRTWGLGQKGADNGALLLVARDDRKLRIEVGYGLEGDLTDARSATIIRNDIVPRFRDGDFEGGILAGTEAILASASGAYVEDSAGDEPIPWWFAALFGGLFTILPLGALGAFLRTGIAGFWGTVVAGLIALFVGVFIAVGLAVSTQSPWLAVGALVVIPAVAMALDVWLERHPVYGPARRKRRERNRLIRDAQRKGKRSVMIDGVRVSVPAASSGSSGGGSSDSSFSGGGGSSGGGGASGSW